MSGNGTSLYNQLLRNVGVPDVPESYITEHGREMDKKLEEHQQ